MHYIRFLKPPRLVKASQGSDVNGLEVRAKITVTTDLGESFLLADVELVASLEASNPGDATIEGHEVKAPTLSQFKWRGGMRSLDIVIPLVSQKDTVRAQKIGSNKKRRVGAPSNARSHTATWPSCLSLRPKDSAICMDTAVKVLSAENSGIVPVWSESLDGDLDQKPSQRVLRRLKFSDTSDLQIWEETGESIERHIWDAGLVLSSYMALQAPLYGANNNRGVHINLMPSLTSILNQSSLNVLELGSGCGIAGLTVGKYFQSSTVTLTDLASAEEIMNENISINKIRDSQGMAALQASSQVVDWSLPLPTAIANQKWNLIVVADCTYNSDVVPDLVQTIRKLVHPGTDSLELQDAVQCAKSGLLSETLVLLAMKVRHESEKVFFTLMENSGFIIRENTKIPLGILGWDSETKEEIEIFLFADGPKTEGPTV